MKHLILFENFQQAVLSDSERKLFKKLILSGNENLIHFLMLLIHNKNDVLDNSKKNKNLDDIFKNLTSVQFNIPLYRGLYSQDDISNFTIGKISKFNRYQSFSRDIQIAEKFAKQSGSNLILQIDNSTGGFQYGEFIKMYFEDLKKIDPDNYFLLDGPSYIKIASLEQEIIFPQNSKYHISNIETSDKFTTIKAYQSL